MSEVPLQGLEFRAQGSRFRPHARGGCAGGHGGHFSCFQETVNILFYFCRQKKRTPRLLGVWLVEGARAQLDATLLNTQSITDKDLFGKNTRIQPVV